MTDNENRIVVRDFVRRFPGKTTGELETLIRSLVGLTAADKQGLNHLEIDRQMCMLLDRGVVYEGTPRSCTKTSGEAAMVSTWWPG